MLVSGVTKLLRGLIPQSVLRRHYPAARQDIFLTFDDGPHPEVTPKLLDLLDRYQAKASFFLIGVNAQQYPDLVRDIAKRGHTVANHSYQHLALPRLSDEKQIAEIQQSRDVIEGILQQPCTLFRAPRGLWSLKVLLRLKRMKIHAIHWSRDSLDYQKSAPSVIVSHFQQRPVQGGDVVLFHDDDDCCIEALQELLPAWQQQGYVLKALES